jgi:hypothetical protein
VVDDEPKPNPNRQSRRKVVSTPSDIKYGGIANLCLTQFRRQAVFVIRNDVDIGPDIVRIGIEVKAAAVSERGFDWRLHHSHP